jgi:hypothetical protein
VVFEEPGSGAVEATERRFGPVQKADSGPAADQCCSLPLYAHPPCGDKEASATPAALDTPDDAERSQSRAIDRLLSHPYSEPTNMEDGLLPVEPLRRISVVGMPWYRKADYARLRASFADGARLQQTYAEWSAAARATEAHLAA